MGYHEIKTIKLRSKENGKIRSFILEKYDESKKLEDIKVYILHNIDTIIEDNWGKFGKEFIIQHIIRAKRLNIIRDKDNIVAFASVSKKKILNKDILYLEFTVVNRAYRGYNITMYINGEIISNEFFKGMFSRMFRPLGVIAISRNPKIVGSMTHYASTVYPDYREFEAGGFLQPASDKVWRIVNDVIENSWNPSRVIERTGCVLNGSYGKMPWLLEENMGKHYKNSLNGMFNKYLEYNKKADKEFVIYAEYNLLSVIKYLYWKLNKIV